MRTVPALIALSLWAPAWLGAQTVYRCGADGRTYSQAPCPDGRLLDVRDERTDEQRAAAQAQAQEADVRGRQLERERLRDEAARVPAQATGFNGRPPPIDVPEVTGKKQSKGQAPGKKKASRKKTSKG